MATFVLEIGSEELPARFLENERVELEKKFSDLLAANSLEYGKISTFATPRRAIVYIDGIKLHQTEKEIIIYGPAKKIAYSSAGEPTKALKGFLASNEAKISDIFVTNTEKGEYVALRKKIGGKSASEILVSICPRIIESLSFAKSMRWGDHHFLYARPIRWILALLDSDVVPFKLGHIKSGKETFGHRVHGHGPFVVPCAEAFQDLVKDAGKVIMDPAKRRDIVVTLGDIEAKKHFGHVIWHDGLLDEVVGLVECPVPMMGEFDSKFLELPREVLLTSMQSHQKSFGVEDDHGHVLPYFLTVLNIEPKDQQSIKHGWEKVLRARLEDARFFWNEDLKTGFDNWLNKLQKVIFIGSLGNMAEKKLRLEELCAALADELKLHSEDKENVVRAAFLSKADLVSGMVGEFDTLQGIMGGIYAEKLGENQAVAEAIKEQYLPLGPDSPLPQTTSGAILAIADKTDTIAGCFGLDKIPTGAADPNGLRRCALGIIRIMISFNFNISLQNLFKNAYQFYGDQKWKLTEKDSITKIIAFFKARMRNYFQSHNFETVLIDAVLETDIDNISDCAKRLEALASFKKTDKWLLVMQAMKRIDNILHKNKQPLPNKWQQNLLKEPAEKDFAKILTENLPTLDSFLDKREYIGVMETIYSIVPALNSFFENIMVMVEDESLKINRMALLDALEKRFSKIAQISSMQI